MGIALWLACGLAAFTAGRLIAIGPRRAWLAEVSAALLAAVILGTGATMMDFGGWRELEWRAALFAFLGSFAVIGAMRFARR